MNKLFSVLCSLVLFANSVLYPFSYVYAQEQTSESAPTSTPTSAPTSAPTLTPIPTSTSTPEIPEVITIEEAETSVSSAEVADPVWIENEDGSVTTFNKVGEGAEYQYRDTQVKITFTKITTPGYLIIREFTPENSDELGIVGKAYEITSDMEDGTFEYNLTLPVPNESKDNLSVKYSETPDELSNAQEVSQPAELGENTITINGLDHFTIFIVVDDGGVGYGDNGWNNYTSGGYDGDHHWVNPTQTGKIATWTFTGTGGEYSILPSWTIWNDHATNAHYTSSDIAGFDVTGVDQNSVANASITSMANGIWSGWLPTGKFMLSPGDAITLSIELGTDGNLAADAIAFVGMSEIYVDDDWAGSITGEDLGDGKIFGINAFSDVQEGIDQMADGGVVNVEIGIYTEQNAPINLGWNTRSGSAVSGERPVDLACGQVTNADFNLFGNGMISQNWTLTGAPSNMRYQRQYMQPGSGTWSTDGIVYANTYTPFVTFGSPAGTEGEWNTRVRNWIDVNGNSSLDEGIDAISGWSNECTVTYDRTGPSVPTIISPTAESYLNFTPILNQWNPAVDPSGIDYYRIQYEYDDHHTFSGYPYRTTSSTNRNHTPGLGEQGGVKFRVQAFDSVGNEGTWSDWRHYYYDATPPSIPVLTWPIGGIFINDNTPLMQWENSTDNSGIAGYLYRIYYNCSDTNDQSTCSSLWPPNTLGLWRSSSEYQASTTSDNTYFWQVQSQDLANNQSSWSDHEQFTIDTTPPAAPTGLRRLAKDDHNVVFACGDYAQIQGMHPDWDDNTEDDFDYYEYSSFNAPNGSIGVDRRRFDDSIFEYNGSWLPNEGTYGFAVRAVDNAGNKSAWALSAETIEGSCQITYDSTAPTDPAPSSTSHTASTWSNDNTVDVTWSGANDNLSGVDGFYTEWNTLADTMIGTVTKEYEETDSTETSPILTDGNSHYFHIATVDNVGNWTKTEHLGPFWIDTIAPDAPLLNTPEDGFITKGIAFSQTWLPVSDATLYQYESCNTDPGDSNGFCSSFKWGNTYAGTTKNVGAGQPNSHFWWRVKARDVASNWGDWSESRELIIDNDAPVSTITAPTGPGYFNSTITIAGNTTDNVGLDSVELFSAPYTDTCGIYTSIYTTSLSGTSNGWSYDWTPSAEGDYCIMAAGTDLAGNIESSAVVSNIIYDTTNPTVNWTSPQDNDTLVGTKQILSSNSDALAKLASVHYGFKKTSEPDTSYVTISNVTVAPFNNSISWDTSLLDLDTYNLRLTVTDKAGNETQITRQVGVAAVVSDESGFGSSYTEATITWTTDRLTSSRVVYDTVSHSILESDKNYGYAWSTDTFDTDPKVLNHTVVIGGLSAGTTYYYRVVSAGSPTAIGDSQSFATLSFAGPPPSPSTDSVVSSGYESQGTEVLGIVDVASDETENDEDEEDNKEVLGKQTETKEDIFVKTNFLKNNWYWIIAIFTVFMGIIYLVKRSKKR